MTEVGKVVKQNKSFVTVRVNRKSSCDKCGLCAFKPGMLHVDIKLQNEHDCTVGDEVEIEISDKSVVKIAFLVYLVPLLIGGLAFLIAFLCKANEVWQFVTFIVATGLGFLPLILIDKSFMKDKKAQPKIIKKIEKNL